jgi:hypothetical protein
MHSIDAVVTCKLLGNGNKTTEKQTQESTVTETSKQTWHLASEEVHI